MPSADTTAPPAAGFGVFFRSDRRDEWRLLAVLPDRDAAVRIQFDLMADRIGDWSIRPAEDAPDGTAPRTA